METYLGKKNRWRWVWVKRPFQETTKEEDQINRDYEICCSKLPIVNKKIEFVELDETYDLSYPNKSDKEYNFSYTSVSLVSSESNRAAGFENSDLS